MPTANRLDKERLDARYMNGYRDEVSVQSGVQEKLMILYQHHNSCKEKYQNSVAVRRLVEEQNTKALLDKYKETSRKENVSLAQDKAPKPKVAVVKSEQQSSSDPSRSQKDTLADNSKELSSALLGGHSREAIVEIDTGGVRPSSGGRSNYSSIVATGTVVKQEEGILLSSGCPHQTTDTISKSLSANTSQQQAIMGLSDNNNSLYSEAKTTSVSSRKSSIGNITTNGFVGLPGKPDDELNLNAESFISENATISFLPSVDADNSDPLPLKKATEPPTKPSMLQRTPSTSNRSEDLLVHENDVEKGMDEFSKVMDQVIKRESNHMRRNSSSTSLCQLPDLSQLPTTSVAGNAINGNNTSSPPPYPGTSMSNNPIKQAAQQLASSKSKYQDLLANMNHMPNVSQPPTPIAVAESNWQQQQQQQILAAKQQQHQQQMMMQQQQQQQHYHTAHPTKPPSMQRKAQQQQQQQQQQYDFMKSASPNVTIVSRDPYHSAATVMNMPQHAIMHQSMAMNQHQQQQQMMHLNTTPVQTMGQPTQMPQQQQQPSAMMSMSRNQPQIYAPLPNVDPYMGAVDHQHQHAALTTRSGSITYGGGQVEAHHIYTQHQQQRRHSMPPQLPTQQHAQWQAAAAAAGMQQHQDLMDGYCSPAMDPHQHGIAGQKRTQSYLPPQIAVAKRNSIQQHSNVLSHTMSPAAFQQHNTLVNGDLNHQAFHNINDPLMHFDNRNDLFNPPL